MPGIEGSRPYLFRVSFHDGKRNPSIGPSGLASGTHQ